MHTTWAVQKPQFSAEFGSLTDHWGLTIQFYSWVTQPASLFLNSIQGADFDL